MTANPSSVNTAIYLRVSTESQNYSTQHQRAAIALYAAANGLVIVREYVDEGKSGLDIRRRLGLRQLMLDVQAGAAPFQTIVVYDVSRWGRFQDVDEAAYHEHTCRRAGIRVVYCAEQFQNNGSPLAALMKGIKRTMAAEYSRELSAKVFSAQCRFIEMGFKQGGHAGYGLRRMSVAADGTPRRELKYGESKGTITDRVVLALGPDNEVATVRRIYALYTNAKANEAGIARVLNGEGIISEFGRPWTQSMVNSVLTNSKYIGTLAYNRRSSKLSSRRQRNSESDWVVNDGAWPQLLSREMFEAAQVERAKRYRRYGPGELLQLLRECHTRYGTVTAVVIANDRLLPDPQLFKRAFGSLTAAYALAGIPQTRLHTFVKTKQLLGDLQRRLFAEVCELSAAAGASVKIADQASTLILNDNVVVRVVVVPRRNPPRGRSTWTVKPKPGVDFTIAARHDIESSQLLDFYLLPSSSFGGLPIYLKAGDDGKHSHMQFPQTAAMFGASCDTPDFN